MATNNSANIKVTNNADGLDVAGGTTARKLTLSGGDVAVAGSGSAVLTFPSSTDTIVGRTTTDTLTNKTLTSPKINEDVAVTATATELNYVDGVTSAIQTQLNAKLANVSEDTTPQLGGDLDTNGSDIILAENDAIEYDNAGSADEKWTGIVIDGTAGATVAVGDLIYLDVTATEWLLADASAVGTAGTVVVGLCVLASTDGNATRILLNGTMRSAAFPSSIALGAPVYISETAGDITSTKPTTTDSVIRVVGFAITAEPNTIYFCPSVDHITHT